MAKGKMESPLRVLIVEDSESDALLIEYELRRGGYQPLCKRVATRPEMERELAHGWDLIICDYSLPGFGALEALDLVKDRGLDIPFIVVSGTIGEETAVAAMKAGAHDYLMKGNLVRLVPAISRELREAGGRRERWKAEERLRENETRFRLLFEDSPISLWENDYSLIKDYLDDLRRSGVDDLDRYFKERPESVAACVQMVRVICVNKATLKMFQAADQAELEAGFPRTFTNTALESFRDLLVALSSGKTTFAIEGERKTLAGNIFYSARRLQVAPGFEESLGKVVVSVIDITERKMAQEDLQKALIKAEDGRDKIDAMLKSVASGLLVIDMSGCVVLMNRSAERTLGMDMQNVLGKAVSEVLGQKTLIDHLHRFLASKETEEVSDLEMHDSGIGELRTIQTRSSKVCSREGINTGVVITFIDVTREREIDRMKSEFIKTAAHELRTPLTTAMGFADLLLSNPGLEPVQQREFLSYIMEKTEVLKKIIDDLFSLGRMEYGGTIELKRAHCPLDVTIQRCVDNYRREWRSHRFEISLPEKTICLYIDAARIGQALESLLSNAVKYSPDGGHITILAELQGEQCVVRVRDEGIGMSPNQKARAFEKFYRADATDTAVGGLGIGMTVAKSIVEAHGGRIWIESEPGQGTVVSFSLPLDTPHAEGDDPDARGGKLKAKENRK